ncbi:hypothetical protein DNTS_030940 [Danionella cerebrum]|uniref:Uncharacterized protein n=1 Tax=Danionella cerebrum TaxID=2873325 RepID=A0A553N4B5_9TELE|nr:hypothetical protein DNTS_030940 [Danionella translucida]
MSRPPPDPLYILRGSGAPVNTLHFYCGGDGPPLLYSGSGKGAVHVWNLNTRRAEQVLESHNGNSVIWLDTFDGSRSSLISQGRDMRLCLWDLSEGRSAVTDSLLTGAVGFCQCSLLESQPGSSLLAHPTQDMEEVSVVEMKSWTQVCSLRPDTKLGMLMSMKMWQLPLKGAGYARRGSALWFLAQQGLHWCMATCCHPVERRHRSLLWLESRASIHLKQLLP